MKSNSAVATSGIITFGSEAAQMFEALPPKEQDQAFRLLARAIALRLRTSLHGLVIHCDEATIHAHFTLSAYNRNGIPLSKSTRPAILSELQDLTAKVMQRFCPQIERGTRYGDRLKAGADFADVVHRSVKELHRDLPADLEAKRAEQRRQEGALALAQGRVDEMQARVDKLLLKEALSAKEVSRLETYRKRLEARCTELSEALRAIEASKLEAERLAALAEARQHSAEQAAQKMEERTQSTERALGALVKETAAGTLKRSPEGRLTVKNPEAFKDTLPTLRPLIKRAADFSAAVEKKKAEIALAQDTLRQDQEELVSQQNAVREEWAEVGRLKTRLQLALIAVQKWLKNPELPAILQRSGQKLKVQAESELKDQDDGPSGP
jgi:NACalpha-BTF3-like transcription factor